MPSLPEIDVDDLKARLEAGEDFLLLDVREADEWHYCRIDGATHMPMSELPMRLAELPRDKPIVCQCHHGMRSAQVAQFLMEQGFANVTNLQGGIHAWSQYIDPAVPVY